MTDPKAMEAARRVVDGKQMHDGDTLKIARALLAGEGNNATAAAVPFDPWQPISTAPKGVKLLLAYRNRLGKWRMVLGAYYAEEMLESDSDESGFAPPGWYELAETHEESFPTDETPTHWQPLDAPPGVDANQQTKTGVTQASDSLARPWTGACRYCPANFRTRWELEEHERIHPPSPAVRDGLTADDTEVMRAWRECGLPEYFLGNGGSNHKLVDFAKACAAVRDTPLREALEKIVDHTGMVGSERIDVLQIALTEINVCARAALSHPIPGNALEKATLAVRDEVGSQLCRWTSIGKRVCEAVPEGVCLCRDAASAALAAAAVRDVTLREALAWAVLTEDGRLFSVHPSKRGAEMAFGSASRRIVPLR